MYVSRFVFGSNKPHIGNNTGTGTNTSNGALRVGLNGDNGEGLDVGLTGSGISVAAQRGQAGNGLNSTLANVGNNINVPSTPDIDPSSAINNGTFSGFRAPEIGIGAGVGTGVNVTV